MSVQGECRAVQPLEKEMQREVNQRGEGSGWKGWANGAGYAGVVRTQRVSQAWEGRQERL